MELIDILNQYWGIIVTIAGIIFSYATLKSQNNGQEGRIKTLEKATENINTIMADKSAFSRRISILEEENKCIKVNQQSIDTRLAQIQTDIVWIRETLKDVKK